MNKKSKFILLTFGILVLLSCLPKTLSGEGFMLFDDSGTKADKRLEQLLGIIKKQDKDALRALFSKKVLDEVANFDKSEEDLFKFFQGNVKSWERDRFSGSTETDYGKKSVKLVSYYIVTTDKDKYMFLIIDYSENTIDPDYAGLYTLRVIKAKDEETEFAADDMETAGIYVSKK